MSSHPGSTLKTAVELALFLKEQNIRPQQVQDFYPTPGTVSTCMFYTGLNPYNMQEVEVPKTPHDKALQRAMLQYFLPQNRALVIEVLKRTHRTDLIGNSPKCLIKPGKDTPFLNTNTNRNQKQKHKNGGNKWQSSKQRRRG